LNLLPEGSKVMVVEYLWGVAKNLSLIGACFVMVLVIYFLVGDIWIRLNGK
jgi:hypothetical protein